MSRSALNFVRLRSSGLRHLPWAVSLVRSAAGGWTTAWALLLLAQGLLPIALVFATRELVDSLMALARGVAGPAMITGAAVWGSLLVGLLLLDEAARCAAAWVRAVQAEKVQDHVCGLIHARTLALDMAFFDRPEFYDRLHRARVDAVTRPAALLESSGALVQNGLTLIAMAGVLSRFGAWLPIVLAVSTLPALAVAVRYAVEFHRWREATTADVRQAQHLDWLMTRPETAAELRLFELGPHFERSYRELRTRLSAEQGDLKRREAAASVAAAAAGLASMAGAAAWMASQLAHGKATPGEVALFLQAFHTGQRMLRTLLGSAKELYRNLWFVTNLFEFLQMRGPLECAPPGRSSDGVRAEVRFEGVVMRYPGSERPALDGFDMMLPAGKLVAVVGENGAGKSTLIKLLCRFYDPDAGRVLWDGVDMRDLDAVDLRRRIAVMFQEPVRYSDTVESNIAFGDLNAAPTREAIERAAAASGAGGFIGRLPRGFETLLGKWMGGSELSVGEWQRLALARAFLRQADLVVLDEPTSAMDSWAESDWLRRFRSLASGRTALVITHRFTTALQADLIYVMQRGRVVEVGSHEELVAARGEYARSWQAQTRRQDLSRASDLS